MNSFFDLKNAGKKFLLLNRRVSAFGLLDKNKFQLPIYTFPERSLIKKELNLNEHPDEVTWKF